MANLSNINDKFLVTTGGNVLIGQTGAVGSSIFQVTGASTFTGNILMGNTVTNPASGFADQTGIGLKYSTTVPTIEVSSDSSAMQLGRSSTGGQGQILALRKEGTVITSFSTNASQFYNLTSGQTGTVVMYSEGGGEVGLTVQSRTNRGKIRVADNDSNAYVVAEAGKAFFGTSANGDATNITVLTSGNVGIGKDSPSTKLHVKGDMVTIEDPSGGFKMELSADSNPVTIRSDNRTGASYGSMAFIAGNGSDANDFTRMTIDTGGNVGIGTGTGAINAKLDVRNDDGLASGLHIVADFNRAAGTDAQMILGYYANGSSVDGPCVYSANGKPLILAPGTEKLRIQNSSQSLRIKGGSVTGSNYMQFVNSAETAQGYFGYGGASNVLYIVQQVDGDIQFYSNGSTRMTINTAGDVGIGVAPEGNIVSYIKQLRIGEQTAIQGHADGVGAGSASWFSTNYTYSVGGATTITTGESMVYQAQSGRHSFLNSESTTAGAVPVLRNAFSIEPNLDLKASTKGPSSAGVGAVYTPPYPLRFNNFSGTGPKFLGVYPLRGGSQFLDIAINTTSDGIMYYAMFRGYFYGRGSRWSWTAGYTYQGSIINVQNHFVLNGNTANLTAYRGAAGSAYPANLCFRMDSGSSGYTEGFGELYMFAHANSLQNAFQVAAFSENNAANPGLWT